MLQSMGLQRVRHDRVTEQQLLILKKCKSEATSKKFRSSLSLFLLKKINSPFFLCNMGCGGNNLLP